MQAHAHIACFHVATADDEHGVDFGGFRVRDLGFDWFRAEITRHSDFGGAELLRDISGRRRIEIHLVVTKKLRRAILLYPNGTMLPLMFLCRRRPNICTKVGEAQMSSAEADELLNKLIPLLQVVSNNTKQTPGGGGTPRREAAPELPAQQ